MPPKKQDNEPATFQKLCYLAQRLRAEDGCPWDREQTIASMLECIEEEAREVRVAIENGDHENLKEELGDVLFQIVMISQIAKEHDYFTIDDVISHIDNKIRSRHTWVFGDKSASTAEEALNLWKENKQKEKPHNDQVKKMEGLGKNVWKKLGGEEKHIKKERKSWKK